MFKGRNRYLDFTPETGMQVLVRGRLSLYEARGDFQLIAEHMEEIGSGALQRQFERRFAQLQSAGLFAEERKRQPPTYPACIGVITSASAAAWQDVLDVLGRRYPVAQVLLYPAPVQGAGAAEKLARQIARAARQRACDVLLLVRGGGSMEDLWAFNEEVLVQAVADCAVPIICGVGHEIDFTLADFAADMRAPTPSAAAELACPDRVQLTAHIERQRTRLQPSIRQLLLRRGERLRALLNRLQARQPQRHLLQCAQRCDELHARLARALQARLTAARGQLAKRRLQLALRSPQRILAAHGERLAARRKSLYAAQRQRLAAQRARLEQNLRALHVASPLATLERGYAISRRDGSERPLLDCDGLTPGMHIRTQLHRGVVIAVVTELEPPN